MRLFVIKALCLASSIGLAACGSADSSSGSDQVEAATGEESAVASIPASLAPFGDGYPNVGDPCRRLGESAATVDWLDDNADLVGCPSAEFAAMLGGRPLAEVDGVVVSSVPTSNSSEVITENGPILASPVMKPAAATGSPSSLEAKCKAEVEKTVGAKVLSTISSDFSEAGTMFRFAVEGADAPWQCIGYSNGTIAGVMYTGSEGSL